MARSKTGGSRAYLRGRVGSDVYSIGKDAKGKKQQVVRSLAESVANPQTSAQMFGRMVMSTVMQAVAGMRPIIDHSFDNVPTGQPNVSEFIRRNYGLIAADAKAHAASGNAFGLNKYQEKGVKQGAYVISAGTAIGVKNLTIDGSAKTIVIDLTGDVTIGGLKEKLGINSNDYFTICAINANGGFIYERFHIAGDMEDSEAISASNVADVFTLDGNVSVQAAFAGSAITLTLSDLSANYGVITSRKQESGYIHTNTTLAAVANPAWNAATALPSYPIGQQKFLNGGGENGGSTPEVDNKVTLTLTQEGNYGATLIGAGRYAPGTVVNVSADIPHGFDFESWKKGNQTVESSNVSFQYTITEDTTLTLSCMQD
jgi:hypothetical protein